MKRGTVGLVAVVTVAALVPLYAYIRTNPVSHPEWARMLLRGLKLEDLLETNAVASQVFSMLSWRESLSLPAEKYFHAEGVDLKTDGAARCLVATGARGEATYRIGVVRPGRYRVRAELRALAAAAPVSVALARLGASDTAANFAMTAPPTIGWTDGQLAHLDSGGYAATFVVSANTCLSHIEVAPPCLNPVEPPGGWQPRSVSTASDVAVTVVKAVDMESELPPAATAVTANGSDFRVDDSQGLPLPVAVGMEEHWLKATRNGTMATLAIVVPDSGLYSISALGRFAGAQKWLLDGCHESVLCPNNNEGLVWRPIATLNLMAGRHLVTVTLAPGTVVASVKAERKNAAPADYMAALKRLGFDVGPEGPISRARAVDAMNWVRSHVDHLGPNQVCDVEIIRPGGGDRAQAEPVQVASNGNPVPPAGPPSGEPPIPVAPPPGPPNAQATPTGAAPTPTIVVTATATATLPASTPTAPAATPTATTILTATPTGTVPVPTATATATATATVGTPTPTTATPTPTTGTPTPTTATPTPTSPTPLPSPTDPSPTTP
jgi:hypothetical protein